MTEFNSTTLPNIPDMTREEMVAELLENQRRAIEDMDEHTMRHQLVRTRSTAYLNALMESVHIDGRGEGEIKGFLNDPENNGPYL